MNSKIRKRDRGYFDELIVREFIGTSELQPGQVVRIPMAATIMITLFGEELAKRLSAKQKAAAQPPLTELDESPQGE